MDHQRVIIVCKAAVCGVTHKFDASRLAFGVSVE